MKRSSLILALTAGFLVLGFGALDARAGFVPLPTTLDQFVNSSGTSNGNFTSVSNPAAGETIGFSSFGYTQATGAPPAASGVHMTPFTLPPPPGETGIQFSGAFNAPAGVTNDWVLTYTVTELTPGAKLTDAYSSITGTNNGGTGGISVSETFTTLTGQPIGTLAVNLANPTATLSLGAGYTAILVTKDIDVIGGSLGSSLSVIDQGYYPAPCPNRPHWPSSASA